MSQVVLFGLANFQTRHGRNCKRNCKKCKKLKPELPSSFPVCAAAGHLSRALVGAQNRSESTSVVLGYGKLSQELVRVVSELEKPRFKELKCGREEQKGRAKQNRKVLRYVIVVVARTIRCFVEVHNSEELTAYFAVILKWKHKAPRLEVT